MKKFMLAPIMVFAAFFLVSCSDGKTLDDLIDTAVDTETADTTDTTDTADTTDTTDTTDTSDTEDTADTADTTDTADTADTTDTSDTADTTDTSDTADTTDTTDTADTSDTTDTTDTADTADTSDTTDTADTADTADSGDSGDTNSESGCVGISIDWSTFVLYEGAFDADITIGNPDPNKIDDLTIEFRQYDNDRVNTGTYDLGSNKNKNYLDCTECVSVAQDCDLLYGYYLDNCTYYFQESGTLTVSEVDLDGNIKGSISAKLREAHESGVAEDYTLITDANGACVEIEAGFFESTKDCLEITVGTTLNYDSGNQRYSTTNCTPNTGNMMAPDTFSMKFKNITPSGEYDLAGTNYGDGSGIFFVLYEDNGAKYFFQKSGTVNITGPSTAVLTDLVLEEVTIQNGTQTSAKVPYGRCLKVKDTTINF